MSNGLSLLNLNLTIKRTKKVTTYMMNYFVRMCYYVRVQCNANREVIVTPRKARGGRTCTGGDHFNLMQTFSKAISVMFA